MYFTGLVFLSGTGKSISGVKNSWNKSLLFLKSAKSIYNNLNHSTSQKRQTLHKAFSAHYCNLPQFCNSQRKALSM